MIRRIAWKNIWRNRTRSRIVILSVIVGMWAAAYIVAIFAGMSNSYVKTAIHNDVSHIQLHAKGYLNDPELTKSMSHGPKMVKQIKALPEVKAVSSRLKVNAMAATASTSVGVSLRGIDTSDENAVIGIKNNIRKGTYLSGAKLPVLISRNLAKKLNVKLRNKVVFTFQDKSGNITSAAFRITGLYKTGNSNFDKENVFLRKKDLATLLKMQGESSEIAVLLKGNKAVSKVQTQLQETFPDLDVKTWKQLRPSLALMVDSLLQFIYLFILIIVLALVFGIVNTMLMAILERKHELGMLMDIGMNRRKIFRMITLETFFLSLVGTPIGLFLAYVTIYFTGKYGIDLGSFAKGLSAYGFSSKLYPTLEGSYYVIIALFIFVATLLASIYPAIKAMKLNPTEATRTI